MKIYVSGAITGYEKETGKWRKGWKKILEDAEFTVFDPWLDRPKDSSGVVGTVREDVRRILSADILLVNGDIPSWGTAQEMVYARIFNTKVYTIFTDSKKTVPFWLEYHSDKVFESVESFVKWWRDKNK